MILLTPKKAVSYQEDKPLSYAAITGPPPSRCPHQATIICTAPPIRVSPWTYLSKVLQISELQSTMMPSGSGISEPRNTMMPSVPRPSDTRRGDPFIYIDYTPDEYEYKLGH